VPRTTSGRLRCTLALADAGEAPCGDRWLTAPERRQCAALPSAAQRADYRAARLAARRAVGGDDAEGAPACPVAVLRRPGRAPSVWRRCPRDGWRPAAVALSLAHRDGRAAAVSAPRGARVGVDVERVGAVAPEHVRLFASPDERAAGPADPAALWALKEAVWKALRLRPSRPLRSLRLEFDDEATLRAVVVDERRLRAWARLSQPWATHVVAVAGVEPA
jgi:4'-phosphopantetheinyl transferase EntD